MKDAIWITLAALLIAIATSAWFWITAPSYAAGFHQCGIASWYGPESGRRTATGDYFDGSGLTAAMPSRSMLGKHVRVTYQGRSVVVLVDDIGPAARTHRIIDLSKAAASSLGLVRSGVGAVCLTTVP